jgi:hypothetical protein
MTEDLEHAVSYLLEEAWKAERAASKSLCETDASMHRFSQYIFKAEVLRAAAGKIQGRVWERKCNMK